MWIMSPVPKIPVVPISYGNAGQLLGEMRGPSVPAGWQGGLAFRYHLGDEKVVVWSARPVELAETAPAGTIVAIRPEGLVVACGDGGLLLEEVETGASELAVGARLG
jgi:methionyl-tRNA formyltransferase